MGAKLSNGTSVLSWQRPLGQLDQVFSSGKGRQLFFHGHALLANSLGLSLLWYLASFIAMPNIVVLRVNSLLFSFLWQEKRELVARSSLTQPSRLGDLGVVDVQSKVSALHVMWVRRFLEARGHPSAFFFQLYLRVAFAGRPVDQVLLLPALSTTALHLLPPFYRSIMVAWFHLSRCLQDGEIVVAGVGTSFCPLRSLTINFVYRQLRLGHTEHRCVSKYCAWDMVVDWSSVWSNLHTFVAFCSTNP